MTHDLHLGKQLHFDRMRMFFGELGLCEPSKEGWKATPQGERAVSYLRTLRDDRKISLETYKVICAAVFECTVASYRCLGQAIREHANTKRRHFKQELLEWSVPDFEVEEGGQ